MDRQCGRQLYDRTCCAKQMWERLRCPMNTKQSLRTNPTLSCMEQGVARQPPLHGYTLQVPEARGEGGTPTPQLQRAKPQPESQAPSLRATDGSGDATFLGPSKAPLFPWSSVGSPHLFRSGLANVWSLCLRPSSGSPCPWGPLCHS